MFFRKSLPKLGSLMLLVIGSWLFLVACGGGGTAEQTTEAVDDASGLLVNPESRKQAEPFIVEGEIKSMNLIPAASPEFLVTAPNGLQYRVSSQPADQIQDGQGGMVAVQDIHIGMLVRATVQYNEEMNGGLGGLVSENFAVLGEAVE